MTKKSSKKLHQKLREELTEETHAELYSQLDYAFGKLAKWTDEETLSYLEGDLFDGEF